MGCHFLLQGIFPTQESNPDLLILYRLSYKGSPVYLSIYLYMYIYLRRWVYNNWIKVLIQSCGRGEDNQLPQEVP